MRNNYLEEMRKFVVPEVMFGNQTRNLLTRYIRNFRARKPLIVTDPGIIAAGWVDKIEANLKDAGIPYEIYQDLTSNPRDTEVSQGAEYFAHKNCDLIVALGGGSPIDCAKGIGIVHTNNQDILDFEGVDQVDTPGPPLICIPTTAGTSADISQYSIITDSKRKLKIAIISKTMIPDVSLIDPETTTTMDTDLTAATGIDALTHAFEAFISNGSSPITNINALESIKLINENLKEAIKSADNLTYRYNIMMGSFLAGLAFSNAGLGLCHAMAHSLGGKFDLAHGNCNANLLKNVVEYNYPAATNKYNQILEIINKDQDQENKKSSLLSWIDNFVSGCGIKENFDQKGIKPEHIPELAQNAIKDPNLVTNPIQPKIKDIEDIYDKAL
jgi:alcohol dehydrogenase class IV